DNALRALAGGEIRPEREALDRAVPAHRGLKQHRSARIPVPDLDRIDAVPVRALACREQKVDRRRRGAAADAARITKRLAEMSAFRMRLQVEQADDVGGG